ncbi:MAG: hypothetical protein IT500_16545, partial [Rubrivivax sp.]|nr:hypothetical protein [Rubrivivax sp.]
FIVRLLPAAGQQTSASNSGASIRNDDNTASATYSYRLFRPELAEGTGDGPDNYFDFTVQRGTATGTATLSWRVVPLSSGATVDGGDFMFGSLPTSMVTFASGQTTANLQISWNADEQGEPDESFRLEVFDVTNPSNTFQALPTTTLTILNDDGPYYAIASTVVSEDQELNEGGQRLRENNLNGASMAATSATPFVFAVTRGGVTAAPSTVGWNLNLLQGAGNQANLGDFTGPVSGTVTFASGQTQQFVTVLVRADYQPQERDESFTIQLNGEGVDPWAQGSTAWMQIRNDDDIFFAAPTAVSGTLTLSAVHHAIGSSFASARTRIDMAGDKDWFKVELVSGAAYEFVAVTDDDTTVDPVLTLFAANGTTQLVTDDNGLGSIYPKLTYTAATSGTYYVEIKDKLGTGTGEYGISSRQLGGFDDYVLIDGDWTNGALANHWIGSDRFGVIETAGDVDWLRMSLPGELNYNFYLDAVGVGAGNATFSLHQLNGTSMVPVATTTSAVESTSLYKSYELSFTTPTMGGEYFLAISGPVGTRWIAGTDDIYDAIDGDHYSGQTWGVDYGIEAVAPNVYESDTGEQEVFFHVFRSGRTGEAGSVAWTLVNSHTAQPASIGSSTLASDFVFTTTHPSMGIVTFAAGEAQQIITIKVAGDTLVEGDELFGISLGATTGGTMAHTLLPGYEQAFTIIRDNDSAYRLGGATMLPDNTVVEGNSGSAAFVYTVNRLGSTSGQGPVAWRVSPGESSADAADFAGGVLPSGTLTFAAGETAKNITVNIAGDTVAEQGDMFMVRLSNPAGGVVFEPLESPYVHIEDNDRKRIDVSLGTMAVGPWAEPGMAVFDVLRFADDMTVPTFATVVGWTVEFNTAGATTFTEAPATTADFTGATSGLVTISAGMTSAQVTLNIFDDTFAERNEFFTLRLTSADNANLGATASLRSTITANDALATDEFRVDNVTLEPDGMGSTYPVFEGSTGDVPRLRVFRISRETGTFPAATVAWTTDFISTRLGMPAASAADFTGATAGTATFATGQLSAYVTLTLAADMAAELNESFNFRLTTASTGSLSPQLSSANSAIVDDDAATTFTLQWQDRYGNTMAAGSPVTDLEGTGGGNGARFVGVARRWGSLEQLATAGSVVWTVKPIDGDGMWTGAVNALDFAAGAIPSGTLSFAVGASIATFTINMAGDAADEPDESFTVGLSPLSHAVSMTVGAGMVTVVNDEATPSTPTIGFDRDVSPFFKSEDQFAGGRTVTVRRYGRQDGTATVQWSVMPETAMPTSALGLTVTAATADDFIGTVFPTGMLTFLPGQTAAVITVRVKADTQVEGSEGFRIDLSMPTNATTAASTSSRVFRIDDDDSAPTFSLFHWAGVDNVTEGNTGTVAKAFAIFRQGNVTGPSTVQWGVSALESGVNAADFAGGALPAGTATFAAGETAKLITIGIAGDIAPEGIESFTLRLSNPSNGTFAAPGDTSAPSALVTTVYDNDAIQAEFRIDTPTATMAEGSPFVFTVTREGDLPFWMPSTVVWSVQSSNNYPVTAADFGGAQLPSGTLTFASGQTTADVTLAIADDPDYESY